jgi:hypothetical protein
MRVNFIGYFKGGKETQGSKEIQKPYFNLLTPSGYFTYRQV